MRGIKKLLWSVFTVVMVGVAIYVFVFGERMEEHIADTNGADNCSLAVLTDAQIADPDQWLSLGGPNTRTHATMLGLGDKITTYYSKEFSGIARIQTWNLFGGSDLYFDLYDFKVTAGNFKLCVIHDGEVVSVIEPAEGNIQFIMENVEDGTYELMIAGESAAFEFSSYDLEQ